MGTEGNKHTGLERKSVRATMCCQIPIQKPVAGYTPPGLCSRTMTDPCEWAWEHPAHTDLLLTPYAARSTSGRPKVPAPRTPLEVFDLLIQPLSDIICEMDVAGANEVQEFLALTLGIATSRPQREHAIWQASDPISGNATLASMMPVNRFRHMMRHTHYDVVDACERVSDHFKVGRIGR